MLTHPCLDEDCCGLDAVLGKAVSLWADPGLVMDGPLAVSLTRPSINWRLEPKLAFPREMSYVSTGKAIVLCLALSIIRSSTSIPWTPTFTRNVAQVTTLITGPPLSSEGISRRRSIYICNRLGQFTNLPRQSIHIFHQLRNQE